MLLLPHEDLVYSSRLDAHQIQERLSTYVDPRLNTIIDWKKKREKQYEGLVGSDNFEITRIIDYRNSFLPVISGKIVATGSHAIIKVTMSLHPLVKVFLSIWCGAAMLIFFIYLKKSIQESQFDLWILFPVGLLAFGYSLTTRSFKIESSRTKEDLKQMLQATLGQVS